MKRQRPELVLVVTGHGPYRATVRIQGEDEYAAMAGIAQTRWLRFRWLARRAGRRLLRKMESADPSTYLKPDSKYLKPS